MLKLVRRKVTLGGHANVQLDGCEQEDACFRIEVWSLDATEPQRVYVRSFSGKLEVEESMNGEFYMTGRLGE